MCNGLRKIYGEEEVICQGVGPKYTASLTDNIGGIGTSRAAVAEATGMFTTAGSRCSDAVLSFGGYRFVIASISLRSHRDLPWDSLPKYNFLTRDGNSQGTAVMHATVGKLPKDLQERIAAGVLFGDTRNKQDKSQVPGFPKEKVTVYCDANDGVCGGLLNVNAGHFVYTIDGWGQKAIKFLKEKIDAALAAKGGASASAAAEEEAAPAEEAPAKPKPKAAKASGAKGKGGWVDYESMASPMVEERR